MCFVPPVRVSLLDDDVALTIVGGAKWQLSPVSSIRMLTFRRGEDCWLRLAIELYSSETFILLRLSSSSTTKIIFFFKVMM